jgi:hypothetical protein
MALKWAARRQVLYYIVAIIIATSLGVFVWQTFFVSAPLCSDGVQNGTESGVDCGGTCAALCPDVARAPVILWSRSFLTSPHTYSAAAYIQNNNIASGAGAKGVHYSFQLLDDKNILIAEREGVIDIPPSQIVPIIEQGIDAGNRVVARTFFTFSKVDPILWKKIPTASLQKLRIAETSSYENGRLSATIANDALDDARRVQVIAVLFDGDGVARAASKSIVSKIARKSSEKIIFTWPEEFEGIRRAEVTVLPSF